MIRTAGGGAAAALALVIAVVLLVGGCSVPTRAKVVSLERPTQTVQKRALQSHHRVRSGETLYTIAWSYGLDFPDLARWNGIPPPYTIYPEQSLRLSPPPKQIVRRPEPPARNNQSAVTTPASKSEPSPRRDVPTVAKEKRSPARPAVDKGFAGRRDLEWQWPTNGKLEQRFSNIDPSRKGIQISGRNGQEVVAAESGKVVYAGSGLIGYGQLIIIKHNKNYLSAYGHNRKLLVEEGAVVKRGEPVAEMGNRGGGRPALHFEIRRNGTPVNPLKLLPRRR